ncbi:hypothetical protein EC2854350_1797 [Escherichia coli 2854350]|nr:hypothetical protein EC2854350_1797 [Escherichia coli 2854350]
MFKDVRHSSSHIIVLGASIKSFKTSFTCGAILRTGKSSGRDM